MHLRDDGKKCAAADTTGERERERERFHDALFHGTESARREPREPPRETHPPRRVSLAPARSTPPSLRDSPSSSLQHRFIARGGITRKMRRRHRRKKQQQQQKQSHATHPVPVSARTRPSAYLTSTIWARLSALSASSDLEPC